MLGLKHLGGRIPPAFLAALAALAFLPLSARGEEPQSKLPVTNETIEVTATRVPEAVAPVPASITVVSGDELRARGATDLGSALALVGGVAIAPSGDGGPAGSVPELWGLREFDAFLLVVDGVPWGGAFNPALPTLDLTDVDRIEVMRGAAPVMYGATSFVGVIQVIHRAAGAKGGTARAYGGSYGTGGIAASTPLPSSGTWQQSISANFDNQGFKDDRTGFERGHVLYRGAAKTASGSFRLDADVAVVNQDPASPHPRTGMVLTPLVPLDANHNPAGSKIDEDRYHIVGGYDRDLSFGAWSTTLSYTHSKRTTLRGFLTDVSEDDPNANGFIQDLSVDDVYFDSHLVFHPSQELQIVAGIDHLYGSATADSEDFDYFVHLNGSGAPRRDDVELGGFFHLDDTRNFSGLYAQAEWTPAPRWRFQAGARLNRTQEKRKASEGELDDPEGGEAGSDDKGVTRGSGAAGVSFLAWQAGSDALWLYADYRDTYKPAALDFGPEAEDEILDPETATSLEVGAKGTFGDGRVAWDVSAFQMDFENLVVSQAIDGLPTLVNAGKERFKGAELETRVLILPELSWQLAYAYHDARFRDFLREFDGVPTQLDGNRLELSAKNLASTGLVWFPKTGFNGNLVYQWTDKRFLNQRNTAEAPSYGTWSAGLGYRFSGWEVRVDGTNLNDTRPPVSESELGDAQYYRLPARAFVLSVLRAF